LLHGYRWLAKAMSLVAHVFRAVLYQVYQHFYESHPVYILAKTELPWNLGLKMEQKIAS
jgi:hypothetical protein